MPILSFLRVKNDNKEPGHCVGFFCAHDLPKPLGTSACKFNEGLIRVSACAGHLLSEFGDEE